MELTLTLKRGSGLTFNGTNWNLVAEKKWTVHVLLVPNGKEKFMGKRMFGGVEHAVFQCLNDEFFAQPVSICELPKPADPGEVVYSLEAPEVVEEKRSPTKSTVAEKILTFTGKNWKLAADKKWKSSASFPTYDPKDKVGQKKIGSTAYFIYKISGGFVAVEDDGEE